jgi:glucokinase
LTAAGAPGPGPGGLRRAIGIDIGGTGLKLGLVATGEPPSVTGVQVLAGHGDEPPAVVLDQVAATVRGLLDDEGVSLGELAGVGIGCAGLVDSCRGVLRTSPNLPAWRDVPLVAELEQRLGVRALLVNDAQAFLAAEWLAGAARGFDDALILTLGTGVGGGLILGGRPYRGAGGLGAEIGHMSLDLDGPTCACGNRGCFELFVARAAIERLAAESGLAADGADTPKRVFQRAEAGDDRAVRLFAEIGRRLGAGLAGLVNLLEPRVIVVGGGIAAAGRYIFPAATRELGVRSMVARTAPPPIREAEHGPGAGLIGAALLAAREEPLFT